MIRVGISCCISYSIVSYLLYALVDQITSVGEERAIFLLLFTYNFVVSLPLGTWFGLRYLLWHSLDLLLIIWNVNYNKTTVHMENLIKTLTP